MYNPCESLCCFRSANPLWVLPIVCSSCLFDLESHSDEGMLYEGRIGVGSRLIRIVRFWASESSQRCYVRHSIGRSLADGNWLDVDVEFCRSVPSNFIFGPIPPELGHLQTITILWVYFIVVALFVAVITTSNFESETNTDSYCFFFQF